MATFRLCEYMTIRHLELVQQVSSPGRAGLTRYWAVATQILLIALAAACSSKQSISDFKSVESGSATSELRVFEMKGTIKGVDLPGRRLLIKHDEVKDFMAAMTMAFNVQKEVELHGLLQEDQISFRLNFSPATNWIDHILILGGPRPEKGPDRPPVRLARNVEALKVGDPVPSYPFTNELGQAVNLANLKGTAFAVTFIYTRCPFPDFCPKMSGRFAETMKMLKADVSAPTNWHLFSITFDPTYDTPRILRNYARQYEYDPAAWSFLTGLLIDIDAITDQLELQVVTGEESAAAWSHRLRTFVVDTNGRLQNIFKGGNDDSLWRTQDLVDAIVKAARAQSVPTGN